MRAPPLSRPSRLAACLAAFALAGCQADDPPQASSRTAPLAAAEAPPRTEPAKRAPRAPSHHGETWNAAQIEWQTYEAGLARARAEKKPVLLVFYADWCPHCRTYSHVFEDERVVERARDFVMIRANVDDREDLAGRYAKDGGYVPRTYFLAPDGALQEDIHAPRPTYRYFFDERDPGSILAGMTTALERFGKRGG